MKGSVVDIAKPFLRCSSDEEDADDGMYDSFFDPKPTGRWNRRGEDYDEERSWHEDESDHEENDANPGADGEDWDGGALFDTGEGREGEPPALPILHCSCVEV